MLQLEHHHFDFVLVSVDLSWIASGQYRHTQVDILVFMLYANSESKAEVYISLVLEMWPFQDGYVLALSLSINQLQNKSQHKVVKSALLNQSMGLFYLSLEIVSAVMAFVFVSLTLAAALATTPSTAKWFRKKKGNLHTTNQRNQTLHKVCSLFR